MVRENAASKSRRYLAEGRVVITKVSDRIVTAQIRGDAAVWDVVYQNGKWSCTCPARGRCSHLLAVGAVVAPEGTP